jgi:hypothetical protein
VLLNGKQSCKYRPSSQKPLNEYQSHQYNDGNNGA